MKIAVITNEIEVNGGGLAYSCQSFVKMLKRLGHEVVMIHSHITTEKIIKGGYLPTLGYELVFEEKLKNDATLLSKISLIISFGGGINGYYGTLLSKKLNVRFWVLFRGSDANLSKWDPKLFFYNENACKAAEKVICLSAEIANNVKLFGAIDTQILVIPNSAKRRCYDIKNYKGDKLVLGTGATHLNEKKGVSKLIEMICILRNIVSSKIFQLDLVGEIDDDVLLQYQEIATKLGVRDAIRFYGRKSREEFRTIQSNWNFYIQASVCEGMGNSIVDAMSMGIPIMLTKTGFVAEYAEKHFPDIIFSSFDPQKMAMDLMKVIDNDSTGKFSLFYKDFLKLVNPEIIEKKWNELLSYKKNICSIERAVNGILSVSLHDVDGIEHDNITTPIQVFSKFVEDIYHAGYRLCSMKEYMENPATLRANLIVCTFDDGYDGVLRNALPIMDKYKFSATVYVCTEYFGKLNDWNYKDRKKRRHLTINELLWMQSKGWEIGSHGINHQSLLRLSDEEVVFQLAESKKILEDIFGPITTYAYPYGDFSSFIEKQVKKYYSNAFLLTQGGVYLPVDSHRIHRYYISEIYQIIRGL